MDERIYVSYNPSVAGGRADHVILNYINSSGNHYIIEAGPSNTSASTLEKIGVMLDQMAYGNYSKPNLLEMLVAAPVRE